MGPNGVAAVASPANEVKRAMMCRSRAAQYAHWQNRTVPRASIIIWLAHAVNVVRPAALRLHIDRVRSAKGGRLRFTLVVCTSGLEIFSMIGRPRDRHVRSVEQCGGLRKAPIILLKKHGCFFNTAGTS